MTKFTSEEIEVAKSNGVSLTTLHHRIKRGWSVKTAINTPVLNRSESAKIGAVAARKQQKSQRSNSWYAKGAGTLVKCPYPNCNHAGTVITKAHCRLVHNMDRKELGKKYGMPYQIILDSDKLSENTKGVRRI